MTVPRAFAHALEALDLAEPLTVDAAYARSYEAALTDSVIGSVGLEIETHLVDLDSVAERVPWDRVDPMLNVVRAATGTSAVTLEPGAQLELSGRPAADITTTVTELREDGERARQALAALRPGRGPGRGRSAAPVPPGQPEAALPGHGAALRRDRPGRVGGGDDELHRGHPGQPPGRAAVRLA